MKAIHLVASVLTVALLPAQPRADVNGRGFAGGSGNLAGVKLGLHAQVFEEDACAVNLPGGFGCDSFTGTFSNLEICAPLNTRVSVYLVALDIPPNSGIQGAVFGIYYTPFDYPGYVGTYIYDFHACGGTVVASGGEDPVFPYEPESGAQLVLDDCRSSLDVSDPQGESYAILGWFDMGSYNHTDVFSVTSRLYLAEPDLTVTDCAGQVSEPRFPEAAGILGFGQWGYDPCRQYTDHHPQPPASGFCSAIAAKPSTWSAIKRRHH